LKNEEWRTRNAEFGIPKAEFGTKSQDSGGGKDEKKKENGQRDLERKFSADKRELYIHTASEETEIEKQNLNKIEKIRL
jgi:hypothetical protein